MAFPTFNRVAEMRGGGSAPAEVDPALWKHCNIIQLTCQNISPSNPTVTVGLHFCQYGLLVCNPIYAYV